jgi:ribosomal protein L13E
MARKRTRGKKVIRTARAKRRTGKVAKKPRKAVSKTFSAADGAFGSNEGWGRGLSRVARCG